MTDNDRGNTQLIALFLTIATTVLLVGIAVVIYSTYPVIAVSLLVATFVFVVIRAITIFFVMLETIRGWWRGRNSDARDSERHTALKH